MKEYIGNCVDNPFEDVNILCDIIDNATEITKQTFLKHCAITNELKTGMCEYPYDYTFHKNNTFYFYTHSAIEYLYQ